MTKKQYAKLLLAPEWKAKRKEILDRDNHCCTRCICISNLQVHHLKYGAGKPWEVPNEWLVTLCESCHKIAHNIGPNAKPKKKRKSKPRSKANPKEMEKKMMYSL